MSLDEAIAYPESKGIEVHSAHQQPHLLATKIGAWQAYNHTAEDCLAEVRDNVRILRRDRGKILEAGRERRGAAKDR